MPNSNTTPTNTTTAQPNSKCLTGVKFTYSASNRTVIDVSNGDREIIVISSSDLSDIACSLESIVHTFEEVANVLYQIEQGDIKNTKAIAHLLQYSCSYMSNLAYDNMTTLTNALKQSRFNHEEA